MTFSPGEAARLREAGFTISDDNDMATATGATVVIGAIDEDGMSRTEIRTPSGAVLRLEFRHGDGPRDDETSRGLSH